MYIKKGMLKYSAIHYEIWQVRRIFITVIIRCQTKLPLPEVSFYSD